MAAQQKVACSLGRLIKKELKDKGMYGKQVWCYEVTPLAINGGEGLKNIKKVHKVMCHTRKSLNRRRRGQ